MVYPPKKQIVAIVKQVMCVNLDNLAISLTGGLTW